MILSRTPRPQLCRRGFTLVELAISGALMSLILAAAYLCLSSGFASQKLVESRSDVAQNARAALTLLSRDLRAAGPLAAQIPFLGLNRSLDQTEADNVDFATRHHRPRGPRQADWCELSYFVARVPGSTELALWRRCDPTRDDEPLAGGEREEIIRGVHGFKLEFYDGFDWFDDWGDADGRRKAQSSQRLHPNLYGMPEAVRITLTLGPESPSASPPAQNRSTPAVPATQVFQTVCRLNLAARGTASESGNSGDDSDGSQPADNPSRAPATPGGTP